MTGFQSITSIISDICEPPVCPDFLSVRITTNICSDSSVVVSWVVDNPGNINLLITGNQLLWSIDNQNFSSNSSSQTSQEPYISQVPLPASSGLFFFKARMIINGTIYESNIDSLILDGCGDVGEGPIFVVPAKLCECETGGPDVPVLGSVWVKEIGVPIVTEGEGIKPVVFKHNTNCVFIDSDSISQKETLVAQQYTVLNSVGFDFETCNVCCDPGSTCAFDGVTFSGGSLGFNRSFEIGGTECLDLTYKLGNGIDEVPGQIILTNTDTGATLFNSGCGIFSAFTEQEIRNIKDVVRVTVTVVPNCQETGPFNWEFTLKCCELDCPTPFNNDPDPSSFFYIEYTTYDVKDRIRIIANFVEGECPSPIGDVIYDTDCVGTCFEEGTGISIDRSDARFYTSDEEKDICLRADCFEVKDSYLPIGILIDCACAEDKFTRYQVYVEGPTSRENHEGSTNDDAGCLCREFSFSSSSSSSSSSSDSSSSSSSESSSSSSSESSSSSSSSSSESSSSSSESSSSSDSSSSSSSSSSESSSSSDSSSSSSSSSSETAACPAGEPLPPPDDEFFIGVCTTFNCFNFCVNLGLYCFENCIYDFEGDYQCKTFGGEICICRLVSTGTSC
jgi:hypothetical protein